MKERPILFKDEMVRAILEGQKTQTRRIVKPSLNLQLSDNGGFVYTGRSGIRWMCGIGRDKAETVRNFTRHNCPFGQPGDRLWVREAWTPLTLGYAYRADPIWNNPPANRWHSSIHMPRCASRITLEITGVRVDRLQDMSESDAISEGIEKTVGGLWSLYGQAEVDSTYSPRASYRALWQSINGLGSWEANPWVWVIEFKRVQP